MIRVDFDYTVIDGVDEVMGMMEACIPGKKVIVSRINPRGGEQQIELRLAKIKLPRAFRGQEAAFKKAWGLNSERF